MRLKAIAIIFGLFFLIAGILGFVPAFSPNQELFGVFLINPLHNVIHIATGVVALWAAFSKRAACRAFFTIFGCIYIVVALLGFIGGDRMILGCIANNRADAWLHIIVGIVALSLGLFSKKR